VCIQALLTCHAVVFVADRRHQPVPLEAFCCAVAGSAVLPRRVGLRARADRREDAECVCANTGRATGWLSRGGARHGTLQKMCDILRFLGGRASWNRERA